VVKVQLQILHQGVYQIQIFEDVTSEYSQNYKERKKERKRQTNDKIWS
jgi:hypothetical protein